MNGNSIQLEPVIKLSRLLSLDRSQKHHIISCDKATAKVCIIKISADLLYKVDTIILLECGFFNLWQPQAFKVACVVFIRLGLGLVEFAAAPQILIRRSGI